MVDWVSLTAPALPDSETCCARRRACARATYLSKLVFRIIQQLGNAIALFKKQFNSQEAKILSDKSGRSDFKGTQIRWILSFSSGTKSTRFNVCDFSSLLDWLTSFFAFPQSRLITQALQLDFLRTMINIHEPWSKSSSIGRFSKKTSSYIINIHEPGLYLDRMRLA